MIETFFVRACKALKDSIVALGNFCCSNVKLETVRQLSASFWPNEVPDFQARLPILLLASYINTRYISSLEVIVAHIKFIKKDNEIYFLS